MLWKYNLTYHSDLHPGCLYERWGYSHMARMGPVHMMGRGRMGPVHVLEGVLRGEGVIGRGMENGWNVMVMA